LPQGGARKLFISGSGLDVDPSFSPDGKKIAFVSGRFGNPHIFVANLNWNSDTEVKVMDDKRLTYAGWYNATPAWTPESDRIAFAGYDKEIDRFDLFMMNPDGTKLERLTLRTGDNERPWFSPNGQNIVFMSNRTNGQNVKSVHQLFVMNRDGSNQRQLVTGLYEAQTPCWGPNL
jgi:TolB protein